LASDLLDPLGTDSLAHRPGSWLATCVHADRRQAERLAPAVHREDDLSLAAEGDRLYLIALARGLSGYRSQK
jgi:hypothetical protein